MKQSRIVFLLFFCLSILLAACQKSVGGFECQDDVRRLDDSVLVTDSVSPNEPEPQMLSQCYDINDNFVVVTDSLYLEPDSLERNALMGRIDAAHVVFRGDLLVVADRSINPQDSIDSVWVKVARDQYTIGWVRESVFLSSIVPDAPISQFIHYFSNFNRVFFLLLFVLAVLAFLYRLSKRKQLTVVHFNDIDSPYPMLLCIVVSGAAVFYGSIQHFSPETWVQFYYYPTLNPFILPLGMACFIACVWLVILLSVAVIDEVFRCLLLVDALTYLLSLSCICMLCYIFFSLSTPYYVGYVCFLMYVVFAVIRYRRSRHYHCGVCGAELLSPNSKCPKCGAKNVR